MKLSRRSFLQHSGLAAGGLAVGSLVHAQPFGSMQASLPNFENHTSLHVGHWGAYYAQVEGGRFVRAVPFKDDVQPSPMISAMPDVLYSPSRVRYPMVRKGFYQNPGASDTAGRGAEPFVRVSWDEAFDMVAAELERVKGQYGNRSIYAGSCCWNSAGQFHGSSTALHRLMALYGGYVYRVNSYSAPVLPVIMPYVVGASGPATSAWPTIVNNSGLVVFFGYNPLINAEVPRDANHLDYLWVSKLKDAGTPVVSVNPITEDTDVYLGTERMAIRPNTDTALMLALAHVLYSEDLYDRAFIDKYTEGFDTFAEYLTGKTDGQAKTPEWAAPITDVSADAIRQLARRMAGTRTAMIGGYSLQRAQHGEQPVWMMVTLAAMLGSIGQPGGGVQMGYPCGMGVPTGGAPNVPGLSSLSNPVSDFVPVNMWADLFLNPGKTIDYDGGKITYPDIKLAYWSGGNPLHHGHDMNRVLQAWQKPETIIVNEYNWTATAKYADIVLPATTTLERNDIVGSSRYILAMKQVAEPLFEARSDFDIMAGLAGRLGLEDQFTEGKGEMDWLRQMYEVAQKQGTARGLDMPDFDNFWEREYLSFEAGEDAQNVVAYADFIADPALNPIGTPSGKFEITSQKIASYGYDNVPAHPTWLEPDEWLGAAKAADYPLHVLSAHPKYRLHSQLDNTFIHDWYEVQQREPMWINPQDAAARGIADGDVVRVFNDRGQLLAGAVLTDQVRPGVVKISEGGWYDPLEPGKIGTLDKHGNVNVISSDAPSSSLADGNPSNTLLAQVEKYQEALPHVTAFVPPEQQG